MVPRPAASPGTHQKSRFFCSISQTYRIQKLWGAPPLTPPPGDSNACSESLPQKNRNQSHLGHEHVLIQKFLHLNIVIDFLKNSWKSVKSLTFSNNFLLSLKSWLCYVSKQFICYIRVFLHCHISYLYSQTWPTGKCHLNPLY